MPVAVAVAEAGGVALAVLVDVLVAASMLVGFGVAEPVPVALAVGVREVVGEAVAVGSFVEVDVGVARDVELVAVARSADVCDAVGVAVAEAEGVAVALAVSVLVVTISVLVSDAINVSLAVGTAVAVSVSVVVGVLATSAWPEGGLDPYISLAAAMPTNGPAAERSSEAAITKLRLCKSRRCAPRRNGVKALTRNCV